MCVLTDELKNNSFFRCLEMRVREPERRQSVFLLRGARRGAQGPRAPGSFVFFFFFEIPVFFNSINTKKKPPPF